MDTIQLQCGQCKQVMAISVAHLGQQVQCPHCRAVVQTPPPTAPASDTVAMPAAPNMELQPRDVQPAAAPSPREPRDETLPIAATAPSEPAAESEFAQFKPKARKDRSVLLLMALIFLVPYALTMTFFVVWLLVTRSAAADGLEYLRDPVPSSTKGGAQKTTQRKQPPHDSPIIAERRTILGKKVKAGDLEVTPLRVLLTAEGDLKLILRARNISKDTAFEPMNDLFVSEKKSSVKPYTFLESRTKTSDNIYGGYLGYTKSSNPQPKDELKGFAILAPRDEITIVLQTQEPYRPQHVAAIAKSASDEFLWRVQLRRGFVKVDGKGVSATTVIGIDFSSREIEKEGKS